MSDPRHPVAGIPSGRDGRSRAARRAAARRAFGAGCLFVLSGLLGRAFAEGLQDIDARAAQGHLDEAQALAARLLDEEEARPPGERDTIPILERGIDLAIRQDDWPTGEAWLARLAQQPGADAPLARAWAVFLEARLLRGQGNYPGATPLAEQALAELRLHGAPPLRVAQALNLLADLDQLAGRAESAAVYAREALEIARTIQDLDLIEQARFEDRLAQQQLSLGETDTALQSFRAMLARDEEGLGPNHPQVSSDLQAVASVLVAAGAYAEGDALLQRASDILSEFKDRTYVKERATIAVNRADAAARMGHFDQARGLLEQAVALWTQVKGPQHPHIGWALTSMGEMLADQGLEQEAHEYLARAVDHRRRSHARSAELARSLALLARSDARLGRCDEARAGADEALATSAHATNGVTTLERMADRAAVAALCGDLPSARLQFEDTLRRARDVFAPQHPFMLGLRSGLAETRLAQGAPREAFGLAREAARAEVSLARRTLDYLPESDGLTFAARSRRTTDLALATLLRFKPNPAETAAALELVANARALVEDTLARRAARLRAAEDPVLLAASRRLQQKGTRYATLALAVPDPEAADFDPRRVDAAKADLEAEERANAWRLAPGMEPARDVGLGDLSAALPEGAALVAFARVAAPAATGILAHAAASHEPSYLAFVLRKDRGVALVRLISAPVLDAHIEAWRARLDPRTRHAARDEQQARQAGTPVTHTLWQPLARHLDGVRRVLLVPDGQLALVNFAALPRGKGYLVEEGRTLHVLSSEREALRPDAPRHGDTLVMVAAPLYDDPAQPSRGDTRVATLDPVTGVGRLRGLAPAPDLARCRPRAPSFVDLPQTLLEARGIADIWTSAQAGAQAIELSGPSATKTLLYQVAARARVMHLATHTYFQPERCDRSHPVNPLLLSGLALGGANVGAGREDDGILTALEMAALDLGGVEWVVLSACGTALGQVQDGEGVLGLRRASSIAGAGTVIMSMMSVEDSSARAFMARLYEERFRRGRATDEALREASLARLHELRARRQPAPPYEWAAFVASGDWR